VSINTNINRQQLPLKKIKINKNQASGKEFFRTMSIYDRPSVTNPHKMMIYYNATEDGVGEFTPRITITDNWGYSRYADSAEKITVKSN